MGIPESQLETWSHQGAIQKSKNTYASIKGCLEADDTTYAIKSFEVFLQGSYCNDTNIRADSDVDIIVKLDSIWRADLSKLPQDQIDAYHQVFPRATYLFSDFKSGVVSQLESVYGNQGVSVGNKAVKIAASSNRLGADVVVCYQYRYYHYFCSENSQLYDEGILLPSGSGAEIINYSKLHSGNCTAKHQNTGSSFKPMVRIAKNMRSRLVTDGVIAEDLAPSYFVEGLLYNVPDGQFKGNLSDTFCNCVKWLLTADWAKFVCPNRKHLLFGDSAVQWKDRECVQYLDVLVNLWNGW